MTLLQTQSPIVLLVVILAQHAAKLRRCEDCRSRPELIVTPDPCYGIMPNAIAGWIGYYAVRCRKCQVHFPGDTSGTDAPTTKPTTLAEHHLSLQNAVDTWNALTVAQGGCYCANPTEEGAEMNASAPRTSTQQMTI